MELFDTFTNKLINDCIANSKKGAEPITAENGEFENYILNDILVPFAKKLEAAAPGPFMIELLALVAKNDNVKFLNIASVQTWEEIPKPPHYCVICSRVWQKKFPTKAADMIMFGKSADDKSVEVKHNQACVCCKTHTKWIKNFYLITKFLRDYSGTIQNCFTNLEDCTRETILGNTFSKRPIDKWTTNGPDIVKKVVSFREYFKLIMELRNITIITEK
jgi:hypothetical protein